VGLHFVTIINAFLFNCAYFSFSAFNKQYDLYVIFQDVCIFLNFPSISNITFMLFIISYSVFNHANLSLSKSVGFNWLSVFSLGNSIFFARILHVTYVRNVLGVQFVFIFSTIRS
jgi:hypothetical protein